MLKDVLTATVSTLERKGKSCVLHLLFCFALKQVPVPDFRLQRSLSSCKSDVPFGVEKGAVVGNGALFFKFFFMGGGGGGGVAFKECAMVFDAHLHLLFFSLVRLIPAVNLVQ